MEQEAGEGNALRLKCHSGPIIQQFVVPLICWRKALLET